MYIRLLPRKNIKLLLWNELKENMHTGVLQ
jgi:hypothetical protein